MENYNIEPLKVNLINLLKKNSINRNKEISKFLNIFLNDQSNQRIFIDGDWGSGKTFFVSQISLLLERDKYALDAFNVGENALLNNINNNYIVVYFNAWKNDYFDDPIPAIFLTLINSLDKFNKSIKNKKKKDAIKKGLTDTLEAVMHSAQFKLGPLTINPEDFAKAIQHASETYNQTDVALKGFTAVNSLRDTINKNINKISCVSNKKIVLIIDELDRCKPKYSLSLLEQTKNLFDSQNLKIIYSLNMKELSSSIQGEYGPQFDGQKYLSRFYDWKFSLARPSTKKYLKFLNIELHSQYATDMLLELIDFYDIPLRTINSIMAECEDLYKTIDESVLEQNDVMLKDYMIPSLIFIKHTNFEDYRKIINNMNFKLLLDYMRKSFTCNEYLSKFDNKTLKTPVSVEHGPILESYNSDEIVRDCLIVLLSDTDNELHRSALNFLQRLHFQGASKIAKLSSMIL